MWGAMLHTFCSRFFLCLLFLVHGHWSHSLLRVNNNQRRNEHTERKLNDDRKFRMVVSLTTSPTRLIQIENSLNSILIQTMLPDRIYFNLPHVFRRANMSFTNLDKLPYLNNSLIYINHCEDLGPATKLLPTLELEKDPQTLIVVVDDDIFYPNDLLEKIYEAALNNPQSPIAAHCGARGLVVNQEKEFPLRDGVILSSNFSTCRFFDAFSGVGYRRGSFDYLISLGAQKRPIAFYEYMNISLANSKCFRSDDLILSNYFALAGVPGIGLNNIVSQHKVKPLHYASGTDALHNLESTGHPYFRCSVYLHEMGVRSLSIKPPFHLHSHVISDFEGIWEYKNKSVVILTGYYNNDHIRFFSNDVKTSSNHSSFNYTLIQQLYHRTVNVSLPIYSDIPSSPFYNASHLEDLSYVHTMLQFVYSGKTIPNIYHDHALFRLHNKPEVYVFLNNEKHLISSPIYFSTHWDELRGQDIVVVAKQFDMDVIPTGAPV